MPDPRKILATVRRATELFRSTPGRKGGVVTLDSAAEVLVVGDLHGNIPAFRRVIDLAAHPDRHLVLQELVHGPHAYPDDGGDRSHQLVDLVCALKVQHPDRVHLILGNHELSELTGRSIAKAGVPLNALFRLGIETAYGESADEVVAAYHALFAALPLLVRTPNRVGLCHTIPGELDLDRFDPAVLEAETWTDAAMKRGGTVYALTWGRDDRPEVVDRFAAMVDLDWFITGHQPCELGHRIANHRQLIIDGTDPEPTACLFDARAPTTLDRLVEGIRLLR